MLKIVLRLRPRLEEGSCVFIDTQHGSKKGMPIKESASCRRKAEGGGDSHLCWLWPHATAAAEAAAAKRLLIKITCHKTSLSRAESTRMMSQQQQQQQHELCDRCSSPLSTPAPPCSLPLRVWVLCLRASNPKPVDDRAKNKRPPAPKVKEIASPKTDKQWQQSLPLPHSPSLSFNPLLIFPLLF